MKVRNLTVRCLAAAVKLGIQSSPKQANTDTTHNDVNNGEQNKESFGEVLQQLAQQLHEQIDFCRTVDIPEVCIADFKNKFHIYIYIYILYFRHVFNPGFIVLI